VVACSKGELYRQLEVGAEVVDRRLGLRLGRESRRLFLGGEEIFLQNAAAAATREQGPSGGAGRENPRGQDTGVESPAIAPSVVNRRPKQFEKKNKNN